MIAAFATLMGLSFTCVVAAEEPAPLEVGMPAPPLRVARWVKEGPIAELDKGRVYVVDFWATWCGPCLAAVPRLNALQEKYRGRATVVGVDIWEDDPAASAPTVERLSDGMDYPVAVDSAPRDGLKGWNGEMSRSWMRAAGLDSIPSTFVVAGGVVAWIGDPMELDRVLDDVLAGRWDIQAAVALRRDRRAAQKKYEEVLPKIRDSYREDRATRESISVIDRTITEAPVVESRLARLRYQLLLELGETEEAVRYGERAVESLKDEPAELNFLAVLTLPRAEGAARDGLVALANRAASRAIYLVREGEPRYLDVLARARFAAGDVAGALTAEEKAVRLLGDGADAELRTRLKNYRDAAASR